MTIRAQKIEYEPFENELGMYKILNPINIKPNIKNTKSKKKSLKNLTLQINF